MVGGGDVGTGGSNYRMMLPMGARCSKTGKAGKAGKAGKVDAAEGRFRRQCARAQWRGMTMQLRATSVAEVV